jgi:hypothetical protein
MITSLLRLRHVYEHFQIKMNETHKIIPKTIPHIILQLEISINI